MLIIVVNVNVWRPS